MQPAAYPSPPVISQEPLKPSGWWYGIAAAIAVVSIVIAVVVFVSTIRGLIDRVDDFERVSLPGPDTVTLEDTGGYSVYHEFSGASDDSAFDPFLSLSITGPDGEEVLLADYSSTVTYNWGDHEGVALYTFTADQPGEYTVSAEGGSGEVAIGPGIGSGFVGGIVASMAIGFGGSVLGGVTAIVVAVKRSGNRRKRMVYGSPFGPGPPGSAWARADWPGAGQPAPGGYPPPQPPPGSYPPGSYPPAQPPGPYAPPQPPPGQAPPDSNRQPPPGLPPT